MQPGFLWLMGKPMTHLMSPLKDLARKWLKIAVCEKSIVSNEDDIKHVGGFNFFQLPS